MSKIKSLLLSILLFSISYHSNAQDTPDSEWTINDILNTEYVRGASFSPNGQSIVWTKRRALKEKDKFISDI